MESRPLAGNRCRLTEKTKMSIMPSQKLGIDMPNRAAKLPVRSHTLPCRSAETMATGTAMTIAITSAARTSSRVAGNVVAIIDHTGRPLRRDVPRSPLTAPPAKARYCWGRDLSSPNWWRYSSFCCAVTFWPENTASTGSPGVR